jgi:hypothetical protein
MPRMLTTAEWICRAREVHGSRYDYSKVEYQGAEVEVIITCLEHGNFNQKPSLHVYRGCGCPKCWQKNCPSLQPSTKERWVMRSIVIHGDRYSYDKAQYVNKETPAEIVCLLHG